MSPALAFLCGVACGVALTYLVALAAALTLRRRHTYPLE